MAVIGTAVIDVIANTAKLEAGMKRAERHVNAFQGTITALATTGLVAMTRRSIESADAVGDMAKQADIGVRSFQELVYAFQQLDVAREISTAGLLRFNKTLGDAKRTGQSAAFKDLGLDPAQFRTSEQALEAVVIRLRGVKDEATRTSIAAELFGKEAGQKMADAIAKPADEFARLRKEAAEVGAVLSEETIAKADGASTKLDSMSNVIRTQLTTSLVELAPALITASGWVATLVKGFNDLGTAIGIYFAQASVGSDQPFENRIAEQTLLVNNLAAAVKRAEEQSAHEGLLGRLLADDPEKLKRDLAAAQIELDKLKKAQEDYLEMEGKATAARGKGGGGKTLPTFKPFIDAAAAAKEAAKFEDYINGLYERNIELITGKTQAQLQYEAALTDLNELYARGLIPNQEAYDEAVARLDKTFKNTFGSMSVFAEQAARNMQSSFADFLFDPFKNGLGGMLRGFADTLRRMAAQAAAARIFESIGGWGTANAGAGGLTGLFAGFASFFGGGKASGGPVAPGMMYEVNERGPELLSTGGRDYLMTGGQGGRVTPLSQGKSAPTINIHSTINAPGADPALLARLPALLDERDRRLTRDIFDAMDRGYAPV